MSSQLEQLKDKISKSYWGEIQIEYRDPVTHKIIKTYNERNLVKIYAKEMLAHSIVNDKVWNPDLNGGEWVYNNAFDDFKLKYIILGASFDENGVALDFNDERYYTEDSVTGMYLPIRLNPGADFDGGLINSIPIDENNNRPLKRIENINFRATYQPAGTPLLQSDVRAMNNILSVETVIRPEEYNGFGLVSSDYFTITEVALAGGKEVDVVNECDIKPEDIFLEGPYEAVATGGDVVSISSNFNEIKAGDKIKLVSSGTNVFDQVSPYYLVMQKNDYGSDLVLDRTPMSGDDPIAGDVHIYKDTLRIFSHRILSTPAKKSSSFELVIRWLIYFV